MADFPAAAPKLSSPVLALTEAEFLDLADRILDGEYIGPMKSGSGPGYELLQALAAIGERTSLAAQRSVASLFILAAEVAACATSIVQFTRSVGGPAVTVKKGTRVATAEGREFVLTGDVAFTLGAFGPLPGPVRAVAPGYQYNVLGPFTTADGTTMPGEINVISRLVEEPPFGDPTFIVEQVSDATGGQPGALAALGHDRGLDQRPGEVEEAYRVRLRALPDTVSPAALQRAIRFIFSRLGLPDAFQFIETWEHTYQTCYDADTMRNASGAFRALFTFDDPRPATPFRNRWLDELDHRAAFIVVVPSLPTMDDAGLCYDDTAMNATDLRSPLGPRGVPAYDVDPANLTNTRGSCYDGLDLPRRAVYKGLHDLLQETRAGGVFGALELEGQ